MKWIRRLLGYRTDKQLTDLCAEVWDAGYEAGQNDRDHQLGRAGLIDPTPNPYWED